MFNADYVKQTELMLRCLPAVVLQLADGPGLLGGTLVALATHLVRVLAAQLT